MQGLQPYAHLFEKSFVPWPLHDWGGYPSALQAYHDWQLTSFYYLEGKFIKWIPDKNQSWCHQWHQWHYMMLHARLSPGINEGCWHWDFGCHSSSTQAWGLWIQVSQPLLAQATQGLRVIITLFVHNGINDLVSQAKGKKNPGNQNPICSSKQWSVL